MPAARVIEPHTWQFHLALSRRADSHHNVARCLQVIAHVVAEREFSLRRISEPLTDILHVLIDSCKPSLSCLTYSVKIFRFTLLQQQLLL